MLKKAAPIAAGIIVTQKVAPMVPLPASVDSFRPALNILIGVAAGVVVHNLLG